MTGVRRLCIGARPSTADCDPSTTVLPGPKLTISNECHLTTT